MARKKTARPSKVNHISHPHRRRSISMRCPTLAAQAQQAHMNINLKSCASGAAALFVWLLLLLLPGSHYTPMTLAIVCVCVRARSLACKWIFQLTCRGRVDEACRFFSSANNIQHSMRQRCCGVLYYFLYGIQMDRNFAAPTSLLRPSS